MGRIREQFPLVKTEKILRRATSAASEAGLNSIVILTVNEGTDLQAMKEAYAELPQVEYAEIDRSVELYGTPDDSLYPHQWALNNTGQGYWAVQRNAGSFNDVLITEFGTPDADIDRQEVYDNPPASTSTVVVAIIDTGVDWDHPDLVDRIWTNPGEIPDNGLDDDHNGYIDDIRGWDFSGNDSGIIPIYEDNDPTDHHGHGSHCSGIVAATDYNSIGVAGIVPGAKIMPLKFYPLMPVSLAARAIIYAADNGADVINMSWGLGWPIPVVEEALDYAASKGVILCAAAGNDGAEVTNYPAAYTTTIAIGATTSDDEVTSFSTIGTHLDISAPGLSILSLRAEGSDMYGQDGEPNVHVIDGSYYLASGTSMASPCVVGVTAYLRSVSPGITQNKALEIMQATALDIVDPYGTGMNLPGWDMYSGAGRVNVNDALQATPDVRARITSHYQHEVVSGVVSILGTADGAAFASYTLEYGAGDLPQLWTEIVTAPSPVTDGLLGSWNTVGVDGSYTIRLRVGGDNVARVIVNVANQTLAQISSPSVNDTLVGLVDITGSAVDPDFAYYVLEYGLGTTPAVWNEITTTSIPVFGGVLTSWNSGLLSDGDYTLRLSVYSTSALVASDMVMITVRSVFSGDNGWRAPLGGTPSVLANYGDFDGDGLNEIVVGSETGLHFFNTDGTPKLSGLPSIPAGDFRVPVAVGKLDSDSIDDFVAIDAGGQLYIYSSADSLTVTSVPEQPDVNIYSSIQESFNPMLFLKDVNGDGIDEVHYKNGGSSSHYIYDADGTPHGCAFPVSGPYTQYLPADLDGNGVDEMYALGSGVALLDSCGQTIIYRSLFSGGANLIARGLSAVDIDGDNVLELIAYGVYQNGPDWENAWIWAFDDSLVMRPGWPHDIGVNGFLTPSMPVFADIDHDGELEYATSYYDFSNSYVIAWNLDGTSFIGAGTATDGYFATLADPSLTNQIIMADIDGDAFEEVITVAEADLFYSYDVERIIAYDRYADVTSGYPIVLASGTLGSSIQKHGFMPTVGDIDQDGSVDMVVPSMSGDLVFINYAGTPYNPNSSVGRMWRYNRRLSGIAPMSSDMVLVCGDVDGSGSGPDIVDMTYLVDYLFGGGPPPPHMAMADVNGDGSLDILDLTFLVDFLFGTGLPPVCN
ncbi:MAG: S8 family serine peptidase [Candidatus Zixiibacteriota bacterium]